jgi:two-component system, chemotaxis family, sensor kinase CheA
MERLARDLARDFGKKVAFSTAGEDTELDRTVVEEIGDPLVHMVRNALDHGLEPPAARVAAGKPETGTLLLKAYHQGSNIVIELQDDGRGIDPEKIHRKAIEKGLVTPGVPMSRDEILALVFMPGFSTAEKITAVSGRGVGMDVVKRNIEKLRGKIEISSVVGRGSVFKIKLPLTMAIIDGLVVRVGEDRFILPSTSVQMALRPTRENISTIHGKGEVLDLRGRFVPIHRLHQRFGIAADAMNPWDGIVVIVETSGKTSALLVDEMVSKQEVVIKNLGAFMQNLPGVAGGAILGDGNIALILDPGSLLHAA